MTAGLHHKQKWLFSLNTVEMQLNISEVVQVRDKVTKLDTCYQLILLCMTSSDL